MLLDVAINKSSNFSTPIIIIASVVVIVTAIICTLLIKNKNGK